MKYPFKFFGMPDGIQIINVEPKPFIIFPKIVPPSTMAHMRRSGEAWNAFRWCPKNNRYEYFNSFFPDELEGYLKKWHNATMADVSIEQWPVIPEMKIVFKNAIPTADRILNKNE